MLTVYKLSLYFAPLIINKMTSEVCPLNRIWQFYSPSSVKTTIAGYTLTILPLKSSQKAH
jgi:hypothetical protein